MNDRLPSFGHLLRAARQQSRISLRAVARAAGVSPSYLSDIERGFRRAPDETVARRLAAAVGGDAVALETAARRERTQDERVWRYGNLLRHLRDVVAEFADADGKLDLAVIDDEVWAAVERAADEHAINAGDYLPPRDEVPA